MWGDLLMFAVAVLVGGLVPGPTMVILFRQTLHAGRGAAFWALLGNEVGVLAWGVTAAFGLSTVVAASPTAYDLLRWVGAGVLILLGVQSVRHAGAGGIDLEGSADGTGRGSAWPHFRLGLVTVISNAKYGIFALSFLPQFVPPDAPVRAMALLLAVIWVVLDAGLYFTVILFVSRMRGFVSRGSVRKVLERFAGVVLVGLGTRLIVETL